MAVIFQTNKKTGITYAYQNEPYWDKEKQQSRAKRTLIGKVDPVTGEIIPTRSYKKKPAPTSSEVKPGPIPMTQVRRIFYGAGYLLDQIGKQTGVYADLKAIFPEHYSYLSLDYISRDFADNEQDSLNIFLWINLITIGAMYILLIHYNCIQG